MGRFWFCEWSSGKSSRGFRNKAADVSPSPPTELGERVGVRWHVNQNQFISLRAEGGRCH